MLQMVGRDSSVGIATRYRLYGPGIESRCGQDFPYPSSPVLGDQPASYTMGTGSFRRGKAAQRVALITHRHLALRLKEE